MNNQNPSNGASGGQGQNPWGIPGETPDNSSGAYGGGYVNPSAQQSAPNPNNSPFSGGTNVRSVTAESRGFFQALFDFSFSSFITVKFARAIYLLNIVLVGIVYIGSVLSMLVGFATSRNSGSETILFVFFLLFSWIPPLLHIIFVRLVLEMFIAVIRTAQNTSALREAQTGQ